jgi:predicted secreted acid phosphatase
MKRKAIIFDIDGTLSDNSKSREFALKRDWDAFYASTGSDQPNEWAVDLVRYTFERGWVPIFLTGRSDKYASVTVLWMQEKLGFTPQTEIVLFMRKEGDQRPDTVVKSEIYDREIADHYEVQFALDDRSRVIEMWRQKGLVALQCAEGNY